MATLNLKERVIEARIAYVGASFVGKSTNLERLRAVPEAARCGAEHEEGGVTWFDLRPKGIGAFDDCEVAVRVVAPSGSDVTHVADADGVVLVVDSDPSALDRNRRAVLALRDELLTHDVPVVVQLNKRDLPQALAEDALVASLELDTWPRVPANASAGDGVVETMRRAIEGVLAMMKEVPTEVPTGVVPPPNPLLSALRAVIEAAIESQMRGLENRLETRLMEAIDQRFASVGEARKEIAALRRELAAVAQKVDRTCTKDDLVLETGKRAIAVDAAIQKQREQMLASLGVYQRTIDTAFAERAKTEQQTHGKLSALVTESCDAVLAALSPMSVELHKLERIESHAARTTEVIDDMREQLEKRKKSWFG